MLNEQLQGALTSRVIIEQAKGVLAARLDVEMEEAFERLRKRSRDDRRRLVEVAEEVVNARSDEVVVSYSDRHVDPSPSWAAPGRRRTLPVPGASTNDPRRMFEGIHPASGAAGEGTWTSPRQ